MGQKNVYVTSDLHLNHKLVENDRRISTEEMIKNINDTVGKDDVLYVIGDFIMGDVENTLSTFNQIHCKNIHLIVGNHDTPAKIKIYENCCLSVDYIHYLRYKGYEFIMCHYPIFSGDFIKNVCGYNTNTYLLFGHLHSSGNTNYIKHLIHVGVDTNDYKPINLDDIVQNIKNQEYKIKD